MTTARGKITVHRRGYYRKPYTRRDGTHVKGAHVKAGTYLRKDTGKRGRTPESKRWYRPKGRLMCKTTGEKWQASSPALKRHRVLEDMISFDHVPKVTVIRRLNALRNVSTNKRVDAAVKEDLRYLRM